MAEKKHVACHVCDNMCPLEMEIENGEIVRMKGLNIPNAMCSKVKVSYDEHMKHPRRLMHPLKNTGSRRGEQKWERISWDQALDEIAQRLAAIIEKYGPESFCISTLPVNAGHDQGVIRRFMNVLGSPNSAKPKPKM